MRIGQPRGEMAHEQRVRALPLKAGGAQRVHRRRLILTYETDDWTGLFYGKDTQGEEQQRDRHVRLIGMG